MREFNIKDEAEARKAFDFYTPNRDVPKNLINKLHHQKHMKVAILYSGGKDSTYALQYAKERGWDVRYLLSVKPTRKDCFLFHYATVEHTPLIAQMLNIPHILLNCDVADPTKEADIVKQAVLKQQNIAPVDAVILGGTGLQETQIRSIQKALLPLKIEVFAAHAGLDHEDAFRDMVEKGYEIMVTQVAANGLMKWLGRTIAKNNFDELVNDAMKYGFHIGFEGGPADTLVLDCPLFTQRLDIVNAQRIVDDKYCGHMILQVKLVEKQLSDMPEKLVQ